MPERKKTYSREAGIYKVVKRIKSNVFKTKEIIIRNNSYDNCKSA